MILCFTVIIKQDILSLFGTVYCEVLHVCTVFETVFKLSGDLHMVFVMVTSPNGIFYLSKVTLTSSCCLSAAHQMLVGKAF